MDHSSEKTLCDSSVRNLHDFHDVLLVTYMMPKRAPSGEGEPGSEHQSAPACKRALGHLRTWTF